MYMYGLPRKKHLETVWADQFTTRGMLEKLCLNMLIPNLNKEGETDKM